MSMDGITIGTALPAPEAMPSAADASAILQSSSLRLSTAQKAAIIISALGPEAAGPIVERIEPAQLERFARTYAELRSIPKNVYNAVVAEFVGKFSTEDDSFNGGFAKTKDLLGQFVEADELTRVMDGINVLQFAQDGDINALHEIPIKLRYLAGTGERCALHAETHDRLHGGPANAGVDV